MSERPASPHGDQQNATAGATEPSAGALASTWATTPPPGERRPVPLSANRSAAERLLHEKIRKAERVKIHGPDPYEAHRGRPLREHLADFRRELEAKGDDPRHVGIVVSRMAALLDGCGFHLYGDLSASRVMEYTTPSCRGWTPRPRSWRGLRRAATPPWP
jgi:hypothetical protein